MLLRTATIRIIGKTLHCDRTYIDKGFFGHSRTYYLGQVLRMLKNIGEIAFNLIVLSFNGQ